MAEFQQKRSWDEIAKRNWDEIMKRTWIDIFKRLSIETMKGICLTWKNIIVTIYIILVVISMIMDVIYNKELGFVIKYPGIVILKIMGIFVAIYWTPKIIFILIECILKSKRRK